MKIKYVKNSHQVEFDADLTTKQLFLSSGFGGGKSYALVMKHLKLSYLNKHVRSGIFAPTIPEYKRDLLPQFEEIIEESRIYNHPRFSYNKSDRIWRFPWTRGPIYVFTCERRIRGPNLGFASINEPGLITYQRFKEILGRVRIAGVPFPQHNLAGTWEGRSHWLGEHFLDFKGDPSKRRVIFGDTRNNAHNLHEDYIPTLIDNYDDIMLKAYLEGLPVNMNGAQFYYAFSRVKNCDESIQQIPGATVYVGMDFNVGYMTASLWNFVDKKLYGFDEIICKTYDADTNKLCNALKARGYDPDKMDIRIYPDTSGKSRKTSGQSDFQILKDNGFKKIYFKPRAPGFKERQHAINRSFDKERIKLNPLTMPETVKDFEQVEQDVADYSKIKDNPKMTHLSDGVDYLVDIVQPLRERTMIKSQAMGK